MNQNDLSSKVLRMNANDLDTFFNNLSEDEMLVMVKVLAQAIGSGKVDLTQPALIELKEGIIAKYGSPQNFAKQFPLTTEDAKKVKGIIELLTLIESGRKKHHGH